MKLDRDKLQLARARRGWSVTKTADKAGISNNSVLRAEHEEEVSVSTVYKLATALEVDVEELIAFPKAPPPPSPRAPRLSEEERRQLAERRPPLTDAWKKAVNDAQQFRSSAKERLRRELSAWRLAKEAGSSEEKRRPHRDEMGRILQEAYDVETALLDNMGGAVGSEWNTAVPAASQLYGELRGIVEGAGLVIREGTASTSEGQAQESFKIEEPAAA